jgi:hypothetical protein
LYDVCEALFLHVFPAHSRCNPVDESWWTCLLKQGCQASAYTANIWSSCCTSWRGRYIHAQWSFCCVSAIKWCIMGSAERCCSQQTSCLMQYRNVFRKMLDIALFATPLWLSGTHNYVLRVRFYFRLTLSINLFLFQYRIIHQKTSQENNSQITKKFKLKKRMSFVIIYVIVTYEDLYIDKNVTRSLGIDHRDIYNEGDVLHFLYTSNLNSFIWSFLCCDIYDSTRSQQVLEI